LVYASSAATYGGGEQGYSDNPQQLQQLRPLNMYGYSKHLFDLYAQRQGWLQHCVGLKFFNVFGPNEYHKGSMQSLIAKSCLTTAKSQAIELFESHRSDYAHGEQQRDFIYVKDAVALMVELAHNPAAAGIINVGTGQARSWNEVARALFDALQIEGTIRYTPMPDELRDKYQYFTQADCHKLQALHCTHRCRCLEDAVRDYVRGYLIGQRTITEPLWIKD
jgi:ADP-L-glycero-D-manno-heptose 6-epimerase